MAVSSPCLFICTVDNIGRSGMFVAKVSLMDAIGNVVSDAGAKTVTVGSGGTGSVSPTSLSIPATGPATTTAR